MSSVSFAASNKSLDTVEDEFMVQALGLEARPAEGPEDDGSEPMDGHQYLRGVLREAKKQQQVGN